MQQGQARLVPNVHQCTGETNADNATGWPNQMVVVDSLYIYLKTSFNPLPVFIYKSPRLSQYPFVIAGIVIWRAPEAGIVTGEKKVRVNAHAGAIS